jgi:hypothetical protein
MLPEHLTAAGVSEGGFASPVTGPTEKRHGGSASWCPRDVGDAGAGRIRDTLLGRWDAERATARAATTVVLGVPGRFGLRRPTMARAADRPAPAARAGGAVRVCVNGPTTAAAGLRSRREARIPWSASSSVLNR